MRKWTLVTIKTRVETPGVVVVVRRESDRHTLYRTPYVSFGSASLARLRASQWAEEQGYEVQE